MRILLIFPLLFLNSCTFNLAVTDLPATSTEGQIKPDNSEEIISKNTSVKFVLMDGENVTSLVSNLEIKYDSKFQEMYITNNSDCSSGGDWEAVSPYKENWPVVLNESDSSVTIYAAFKDASGTTSNCYDYTYSYKNSSPLEILTPVENSETKGFQVLHGKCTPEATLEIRLNDLDINLIEQCSSTGDFHAGVSFSTGIIGENTVSIKETRANGGVNRLAKKYQYQNNGLNSGVGFDDGVTSLSYDTVNDKIYVAGDFKNYNGIPVNGIVRLNPDMSIDNTFNAAIITPSYYYIYDIELDPATGKLYVAGDDITTYGGASVSNLIRLNLDGSLDSSFTPGTINNGVLDIAIEPITNKLFIGGWFTTVAGTTRGRIAKLNYNGSLDTSFNPGSGVESDVERIYLDPTSTKVYVVGWFNQWQGAAGSNLIIKLNSDGTRDNTFTSGLALTNNINALAFLPSSSTLLVGGPWFRYPSGYSANIASLDKSTGTSITPFNISYNFSGEVLDFVLDTLNNHLITIGGLGELGNKEYHDVMKFDATTLQPVSTFTTGIGTEYYMDWRARSVIDTVRNRIYVGGYFSEYNNIQRKNLFVIDLVDGSLK